MGLKPLSRPREQLIARAVELYQAGRPLTAIGHDLSVCKKTAWRLCLEGGCQMRRPGERTSWRYPASAAVAAGAPRGKLPPSHPLQHVDDVITREAAIIAALDRRREIRMAAAGA